ncbi:MAG: metallophosphoesterase family protein [Deltaproteobacteria bacterium]|nr:metallophosphoesterase family protein [Deltaproteobacteria bacterium]
MSHQEAFLVGIISGTSKSLRPETFTAFLNADLIIHAGDIGSAQVLKQLGKIAPVHAVRGAKDKWAVNKLENTRVVKVADSSLFVIHDSIKIRSNKHQNGYSVVISGDKNKPSIKEEDDILYINPGTTKSGNGSDSVALLVVAGSAKNAEIISLDLLKRKRTQFSDRASGQSGSAYSTKTPKMHLPLS